MHRTSGTVRHTGTDLPLCALSAVTTSHATSATSTGGWRGVAGEHTVRLGERSSVSAGIDAGLPVLDASVGAFTRLWLGVRPATGLALTDDLAAPPELLEALDEVFALPPPRAGWPY